MSCRATWGSPRVSQEAEGAKERALPGASKGVLWEGLAEAGVSESGLDHLNSFSGLWAIGVASSCLLPGTGEMLSWWVRGWALHWVVRT